MKLVATACSTSIPVKVEPTVALIEGVGLHPQGSCPSSSCRSSSRLGRLRGLVLGGLDLLGLGGGLLRRLGLLGLGGGILLPLLALLVGSIH